MLACYWIVRNGSSHFNDKKSLNSPVIITVFNSAKPTPTAMAICPLLAKLNKATTPSVASPAFLRGAQTRTAVAANTSSV